MCSFELALAKRSRRGVPTEGSRAQKIDDRGDDGPASIAGDSSSFSSSPVAIAPSLSATTARNPSRDILE